MVQVTQDLVKMEPPQPSTTQMQESEGKESPGAAHQGTPIIQVKEEPLDIKCENAPKNGQSEGSCGNPRGQQHENPQGTTVIASQRHRMITETGHIREISESPAEHYEQSGETQYHQQNIAQHYASSSVPTSEESFQPNVIQHSRSPREIPPPINDKIANGNNHVLSVPLPPSQHQSIYLQVKENEEFVRYQNALPQIVRYEHPNTERYHPRYHPYQHHPSHISQPSSSVKAEMEGEPPAHQAHSQQQHIVYQVSETAAPENNQGQVTESVTESKAQYTNLEPMQSVSSGQSYYTSIQEYQPGTGNLTYLQGPSKGEYYAIQASGSPPNHILYKNDPTLTSAAQQNKQHQYSSFSNAQQLYENTTVQPSSPTSQAIYTTYCKTDTPYWHPNPAGLDANNFNGTIVIENGEYLQNGPPTWIPDGYDGSIVPAPGEPRECVGCSNMTANWSIDQRGHIICYKCNSEMYQQRPMVPRQPNRPQKMKAQSQNANTRRSNVQCANCHTSSTTLWRRNNAGEPVCNACGLYFKLHGVNRPLTMKKDGIQTRKRKPKSQGPMKIGDIGNMQGWSHHGPVHVGKSEKLGTLLPSQIHSHHDANTTLKIYQGPPPAHTAYQVSDHQPGLHYQSPVQPPPQNHSPLAHMSQSANLARHGAASAPPPEPNRQMNAGGDATTATVITSTNSSVERMPNTTSV